MKIPQILTLIPSNSSGVAEDTTCFLFPPEQEASKKAPTSAPNNKILFFIMFSLLSLSYYNNKNRFLL